MAELRHVAILRVTPNAFALIRLSETPPHLVLPLRDILTGLDRCRSMHVLRIDVIGTHHMVVILAHDFIAKALAALGMQGKTVPLVRSLGKFSVDPAYAGATITLDVMRDVPMPPLPDIPVWEIPHPYVLDDRIFWPAQCYDAIADMMASPDIAAIDRACRSPTLLQFSPPFSTTAKVIAFACDVPFFPLLCAALGSAAVRDAAGFSDLRVRIPNMVFWNFILHAWLRRAIEVFWCTDAQAVAGIRGIPNLRALPLPAPRMHYMMAGPAPDAAPDPYPRFESTLDGSHLHVSEAHSEPPLLVPDHSMPMSVQMRHGECREFPTSAVTSTAERSCVGALSQAIYDWDTRTWYLCAEDALEAFLAVHPHAVVPLERRRVVRQLAFFHADEPIPAGAVVLSVCERPSCEKLFDPGMPYALVDLAPGQLVATLPQSTRLRQPKNCWPVSCVADLPHPLRSDPASRLVLVEGRRYQCNAQGPSVCLDPEPTFASLSTVLAYGLHHNQSMTAPAPTAVFACTPPAYARMPEPRPKWMRCRSGCSACDSTSAVAVNGDAALLLRSELACVLFWHWRRFAEHMFCDSPRAAALCRRWLLHECYNMPALAVVHVPTISHHAPATDRMHAPPTHHAPATERTHAAPTDPNAPWTVPHVFDGLDERLHPLHAQIIFLLSLISNSEDYNKWIQIGGLLRSIDPGSHVLSHIWHWWSKKYGGDKYKVDKDFVTGKEKWKKLNCTMWDNNMAACMRSLASLAKKCMPGERLTYTRESVSHAIDVFWADGKEWFDKK